MADAVCSCPSGDGSLRWPCPQHPLRTVTPEVRGQLVDAAINQIESLCVGLENLRAADDREIASGRQGMPGDARAKLDRVLGDQDAD